MAGNQQLTIVPPASSPYHTNTSDHSGTPLVSCEMNRNNYPTWYRLMRRALRAKNKLGFVDGSIAKPDKMSPDRQRWDMCNDLVASWIINSLEKTLQKSVVSIEDAKTMWDELKHRFLQGNAPCVYQIKVEILLFRQEGKSVAEYYTHLKGLWDELDDYSELPECICTSATAYLKVKEVEKLFQFLMGLNNETYGIVRSQILSTNPLPNLQRAYSLVVQEETQ